MSGRVRVAIATTAGPVSIERIAPVGLRKSKVFVWGGREPLPAMSESYDDFVRKRVARIPPFDRSTALRLDVSHGIDTGESWQLAVFLAHALHGADRLAGHDEDDEAGVVLYATGRLDVEMAAAEIGHVEEKLRLLACDKSLRRAADQGKRIIVALPEVHAEDARPVQEQLRALGVEIVPVRDVPEFLLQLLDLPIRTSDPHPDDPWEGSPLRGLQVFDVRHRSIFCGRSKAREEAMQVLRQQERNGCAFLLIHGSSGVGKSSLARAALLADLEHTTSANDRWRSAIVVPRRTNRPPVLALAEALAQAVPELGLAGGELSCRILANPPEAVAAIAAALTRAETKGRVRIALLVDQLEELFLWAREQGTKQAVEERDAFATMLSWLAHTRQVWVVTTLRSDLMSLLGDSEILSELAQDARLYRLERPRPGALGEIIRGPAELAGIHFVGLDADGRTLVEVLTDAAKRQQDCLPLLEFTLTLLYDEAQGQPRQISYQQFEKLGGLENAIGTLADRVVDALDDEAKAAVDDVIFNLARRGRDTDVVVAAELVLDDRFLTPAREAVISALAQADARLIVLDSDRDARDEQPAFRGRRRAARVAHEALLTHWPRAKAVFEKHAAKLALKDDIAREAVRWRDQERQSSLLILAHARVSAAKELLADAHVALTLLEREYIEESDRADQRRIELVKVRLAGDEQKVSGLIHAGKYGDAGDELCRIASYLADETNPDLEEKKGTIEERCERMGRLEKYDAYARSALQKAGEEDFEQARLNCEIALQTIKVLTDEEWWSTLPIEDLDPDQIQSLRQNIYLVLLVRSGLQLAAAIPALFPSGQSSASPRGGQSSASLRILFWVLRLVRHAVPGIMIAALLRRGGLGRLRFPTRQDNAEARTAIRNCRTALAAVQNMEDAEAGPPLQARRLVERLAGVFSELADGPKGKQIDFSWLLSGNDSGFAEPVNAADYFLIALLNFFIAKRGNHGAAAAFLSLVKGSFPEIDPRTPLSTAARLLRVAIERDRRNYWAPWLLGRVLLEAKDHDGAELSFNTAIALEPDYARGYEQRAVALAKQSSATGDKRLRKRAIEDSERARQYANGDPSIFWPRGELFDELGQTADAFDVWSIWLELEQDILGRIARSDGVKRLFDRTTTMLADRSARPFHGAAQALLALVHWTQGDNTAALKGADAAIALEPRHPHALAVRGAVLLKMGCPERALAEGLDPALAVDPGNIFARKNRAEALEAQARSDEARTVWKQLAADGRCPSWIRDIANERLPCSPQTDA